MLSAAMVWTVRDQSILRNQGNHCPVAPGSRRATIRLMQTREGRCPIRFSAKAIEHLVGLREQDGRSDVGLLVEAFVGGSPDDPAYEHALGFEPVLSAGLDVAVFTVDGLKVMIPSDSLRALSGSSIDVGGPSGLSLRNPNRPSRPAPGDLLTDDEVTRRVQDVLRDEVNPMLQVHGGAVELVGHDGRGTVVLRMLGGCQGCALSKMTMFDGVFDVLKSRVDAVVSVVDATDHASGTSPYYPPAS